MSDVVFFVKMFFLTVFLVLAMQIQVGEQTMEWHAMRWVQTSALVGPLNGVAHGGAKLIQNLTRKIHGAIERNTASKKQKEEGKAQQEAPSMFRWNSVRQTTPEAPMTDDPED